MFAKTSSWGRSALGVLAAVAILVGCSNGGSQSPLGLSGPAQNAAPTQALGRAISGGARSAHRGHIRSWMAPGAAKSDLLYIADNGNAAVYVYSWPQGQLMGQLEGFNEPHGECVDEAGNVFITDPGFSEIFEYAHGGTSPIATLSEPQGEIPAACSVNNQNGTLAVMNQVNLSGGSGSVWVYKHSKGPPTEYSEPGMYFYFYCGYDNKGNLYIDGTDQSNNFLFAELPKGSTSFTNITLNQTISYPGNVQWDGTYVAVGDQGAGKYPNQSAIYQFAISGSVGTKVGTTPLGDTGDIVQFWKLGKKVIGPNTQYSDVLIYDYPAGGAPIQTITGLASPVGSTVSKLDLH
jgi:hypothetical protein